MKNYLYLPFLTFLIGRILWVCAQQPATSAAAYRDALLQKTQLQQTSIVKNIPFQNIGPTIMSGRVVDVDVNPEKAHEFYVAYASGGLWYTKNNGVSFTPVLDHSDTQNIGDIAVDWESGTLWVGTGENNASRSSYAGIGMLKSSDHGKTWEYKGLPDSHHIGRVVINPKNKNEVVVGVVGHLYSPNKERGIYKTIDGGQTWKQTLFINDETGIIDITVAPDAFNVMYASAWQKDRKAWNFLGNGESSGIYKSTDGGETWKRITTPESGFPTGKGIGRIGLSAFDQHTVYAVLDNQFLRKNKTAEENSEILSKDDFKTLSVEEVLTIDNKKLDAYLKRNNFPKKYQAGIVKQMLRSGAITPADLARYLEDSNTLLVTTPVIGAEVYRSDDGGITWKKTHPNYLDDVFYSYGYYFGQIRVAPDNVNTIYIAGVPLIKSIDGGKTFVAIGKENVHADHHAIWINPKIPGHIINGNDGGINISYDDGSTWIKNNPTAVGQFYAINIDHQTPYHVYGGLQDNGVWEGPHNAMENRSWHQNGKYPWENIMGGDGMQIQIDSRDIATVYTGYQFGNYFRLNRKNNTRTYIQPKHQLGESPYRFNWQTPILLSQHHQDILYLGSHMLHRSMDQGNTWTTISEDLTTGGKKGNVAYGTITTISESPLQFGLLYTGSDDGLVHVTRNGGGSWEKISGTLPESLWVSSVVASSHKKERVYITLNGYRWDDFHPYIYLSDDYGNTWKKIASNLPFSPVNVIREDPENERILYLGTDNGLYVSFNRGAHWHAFVKGMPNVAVHDLVIQPEAKDLLVGTHGRSIYRTSIAPLQQFTSTLMNAPLHLFEITPLKASPKWGNPRNTWATAHEPTIQFTVYAAQSGTVTVAIYTADNILLHFFETAVDIGFNYIPYSLTISASGLKTYKRKNKGTPIKKAENGNYYLPKGIYRVQLKGNGIKTEKPLEIK